MNVDDIRKSYLEFFRAKAHPIVASDSLVPQNDPTLLFTGAGMNQFKDYFLGVKKDLKRATSSQKCLRTGDLDEVGRTPFHHSFFEMLGNFSFGDYFKEEAITWAWEYLTEVLKISKERLRVTVHQDDDEAYKIWRDKIKIRPDWLYKCNDKSNFWPANAPADGPNGPCGPCSEIYFDQNPDSEDNDISGRRFAEIWNLVFTQFDRQDGGKLVPLAQKNIDTGMGLERLACVLQGKSTNFEIDIFQPINRAIFKILGLPADKFSSESKNPLLPKVYSITDHVRAVTFALTDGVIPANDGRGYVIRKLIRRALYHARELTNHKLSKPFLYELVPIVAEVMKKQYPEIADAAASVSSTLKGEEVRFLETLETGLTILRNRIKEFSCHSERSEESQILRSQKPLPQDDRGKEGRPQNDKRRAEQSPKILPGAVVFELYDTYGFPDELTKRIAEQEGFTIDQVGFDREMDAQRKRAKGASQISGAIFVTTDLEKKLAQLPVTEFLGYTNLEANTTVLLAEIQDSKGVIVLDQTPFYGESGGQVGDQGILSSGSFKARVVETQKKDNRVLHLIEIESGSVKAGDPLKASVDTGRRNGTMRNHTATHLLHAALRQTLGNQVRQLGSLVAQDRLRFDYSFGSALAEDQIQKIEDLVNAEILKDTPLSKLEQSIDEAKASGAIAFFGEKYGTTVRVITVPGFSKELCAGTHCDRTGQIGAFVILSDSSIASGTRRIEALTGEGVLAYLRTLRTQFSELGQALRANPEEVLGRVLKLQDSVKKLEKEKVQGAGQRIDPKKVMQEAREAGSVRFIAKLEKGLAMDELRSISDALRQGGQSLVYLLASQNEEKTQILLGVSHDLVKSSLDLRELWKEIIPLCGASGGGRKDLIQGGTSTPDLAVTNWNQITETAIGFLKQKKLS